MVSRASNLNATVLLRCLGNVFILKEKNLSLPFSAPVSFLHLGFIQSLIQALRTTVPGK